MPGKQRAFKERLSWFTASCAFTVATSLSSMAYASVSNIPPQLSSGADPNIMFIIDDSGSMHWEVTPDDFVFPYYVFPRLVDGIYGGSDYTNYVPSPRHSSNNANERATARALRSSSVNRTYYNPAIHYTPWVDHDGTMFPNANPSAAFHHPIRTNLGTRNLTSNRTESAGWLQLDSNGSAAWASSIGSGTRSVEYYPAVYAFYTGGTVWNSNSYQWVEIRSTNAPFTGHGRTPENRPDCNVVSGQASCTYAQEIQNFANWYTYYRSRILASQAAIGRAFADLGPAARVGYGTINTGSRNVDGVTSNNGILLGVRRFEGASRQTFYNNLYRNEYPASGTPLRRALQGAGEYYRRTDNRGPWGDNPGSSASGSHAECRQSYTILMTDGYWNGENPSVGNADGTSGPLITGPGGQSFQYTPSAPFSDNVSNTLADVAMHFWKNDLRPDLNNRVPTFDTGFDVNDPQNDKIELIAAQTNPAFWQHMVTYGVALGVVGNVEPDEAFRAIETGTPVSWASTNTDPGKIDDLLHAAVNSRGGFFNAADPITFGNQLGSLLDEIAGRAEDTATSAAASASVLSTTTERYRAGFRSADWSGTLDARRISNNALVWDAEAVLRATPASQRRLFTHNGSSAVPLGTTTAGLASAQATALNRDLSGNNDGLANNRLRWLRGEANTHTSFRGRGDGASRRLLGDIVNSNPQLERKVNFGHAAFDSSYNAYRNSESYRNRPDVLYVGSNGGFLHAFRANNGEELFAYMPGELLTPDSFQGFAKVNRLMDRSYADDRHRYYVDGTPTIGDVYFGGKWRTVLIGSMGVGGRTVFALDISDPLNFSTDDVLWEFTHSDLGAGVDRPQIARLENGQWAAIFGNGKASNNGKLFAVNIATGALIRVLDAGTGGLSAPVITANAGKAEFAYAGNMDGELWRFDLSSANTGQWTSERLFTATDANGKRQPITSRPRVAQHPDRADTRVVAFGTGSMFRNGDRGDGSIQSLYGIFDVDNETTNVARADLQAQTITGHEGRTVQVLQDDGTTRSETYRIRKVSDNTVGSDKQGWFLDLPSTERVVSQPTFPSGIITNRIRFTTLFPDSDVCNVGVDGFLMELNLGSGGRLDTAVFDLERDGEFHDTDISGIQGIIRGEQITTVTDLERGIDRIVDGGETAPDLLSNMLGFGRQSWEQLR